MDRLLFIASSFICTKQTVALFDVNDDCTFKTYIIENGQLLEGEVIDKLQTTVFQDCLRHCSKQKKCTAVNFLLDVKDEPICLLVDQTAEVNESEMPIPESIMYSAASICLPQELSERCAGYGIWLFEKFSHMDLIDDNFANVVEGIESLEQCLATCLEREQCSAVLFNNRSRQCRHSKISIQNVHNLRKFFKRSADVDLYESNCYQESSLSIAQCQFIRMHSSGFTDLFDERVLDVSDEFECERTCLRWNGGSCRSFTYDRGNRMCYLRHTSPRTLNKNLLENYDSNLTSGDLEDCMQFRLDCKPDRMQIHGTSMKMFSGALRAKNDKSAACEKKFTNVYNFFAEILYDECGTRKTHSPYLTFSNLIMLKEGSTELITVRDKMLQINCHLHSDLEVISDQPISFRLQIEDENITKHMLTENLRLTEQSHARAVQPKYTLEVLNANKNPAEAVHIGDEGYLLITLHGKPVKFSVIDVTANDINSGRTFTIINSDGCAVPDGMLKEISRIDKNHLQLKIIFGGFPDKTDIVYRAYTKPCEDFCVPDDCSAQNFTENLQANKDTTRKRRSMLTTSESRLFELSGDLYAVRSSNKLKIRPKKRKTGTESNDSRTQTIAMINEDNQDIGENNQVTATRIGHLECATEELKCFIIFMALCLQAAVLVVIIGTTYIIIQHCTRKQRNAATLELIQNGENEEQLVSSLTKS